MLRFSAGDRPSSRWSLRVAAASLIDVAAKNAVHVSRAIDADPGDVLIDVAFRSVVGGGIPLAGVQAGTVIANARQQTRGARVLRAGVRHRARLRTLDRVEPVVSLRTGDETFVRRPCDNE